MRSLVLAVAAALGGASGIAAAGDMQAFADAQVAGAEYVMVARRGVVVAERRVVDRPASFATERSANISITGLGIGALLRDGRLPSVDVPVGQYLPAWAEGEKGSITVRMLLEHTSGLPEVVAGAQGSGATLIEALGAARLASPPGKALSYNVQAHAVLLEVIAAASGEAADAYLVAEVLGPMGIVTQLDDGGKGLQPPRFRLTTAQAARVGLTVLAGGRWDGTVIAPWEYVTSIGGGSFSDELGVPAFDSEVVVDGGITLRCANGYLDQMLVVVPAAGLVAVRQQKKPDDWMACDDRTGFAEALAEAVLLAEKP